SRQRGVERGYGNDGYLAADEIGGETRQAIIMALRPAVFDRDVPALDVTGLTEAAPKGRHQVGGILRRPAAKKPDHRHRQLLRAGRKRPCRSRAAEQRDELATPHSTTSSASASNLGGISKPSFFAV